MATGRARQTLLSNHLEPGDPHPFEGSRVHLSLVAEFSRLPDEPGRYTAALLRALAEQVGDVKASGHLWRKEPVWEERPGMLPREHRTDNFRGTLSQLAADERLGGIGREYPSLYLGREVGRGQTRRTMLLLNWVGGTGPGPEYTLVLSLSLADVAALDRAGERLMAITHRFFDLAAASGVCTYGLGDIADQSETAQGRYYTWGPYVNGRSRFQRYLEQELWSMAGPRRANFVRGVFWANYFSPLHMRQLGGAEALDEFRGVAGADGSESCPGIAKEYPGGAALIVLGSIDEPLFTMELQPWFQGELFMRRARWLAITLARARLPIWFDEEGIPKATDGAGYTPPAAPPPPTDEEIAAYMAHMWDHPPRCMGDAALRPSAKEIAAMQIDAGRYATMFHIGRGGVHEPLQVWGSPAEGGTLGSPLMIGAPIQAIAAMVFDAGEHGYNGELGLDFGGSSKRPRMFECPGCGHAHFLLSAEFQYSGGNEELTDPVRIARRQDFFSGFTLRGRCAGCRRPVEIASVECA